MFSTINQLLSFKLSTLKKELQRWFRQNINTNLIQSSVDMCPNSQIMYIIGKVQSVQ